MTSAQIKEMIFVFHFFGKKVRWIEVTRNVAELDFAKAN
jgi:hypothetical protein